MDIMNEEKKDEEFKTFLVLLDKEFEACKENREESIKRLDLNQHSELLEKFKGIEIFRDENCNSLEISKKYEIEHNKVLGMIRKLESLRYIVNVIQNFNSYHLTEEGKEYATNGSPEYCTFMWILQNPKCTLEDVKRELGKKGELGVSMNLKNKTIKLNKNDKSLECSIDENKIKDHTRTYLELIEKYENDEETLFEEIVKWNEENDNNTQTKRQGTTTNDVNGVIQELKKRKMIEVKKNVYSYIIKTSEFKTSVKKKMTDLTFALLKNAEYEKYDIKQYNFFSSGKKINKGNYHLLTKQMKFFKDVFLSLGFEEMDTNLYVESSFWCFDALYIPQQHPSRDLQDTFFIKNPEVCVDDFTDTEYINNVSRVHTSGDYESFGWNYPWKLNETKRNVLRTHTTANSARALYKLAKQYKENGYFRPKKYFSIDKVFRNENLDSTHLAEFHQVEGLVLDRNLGLNHLIGVLSAFYKRIGINKLKFKPAFNPYTEPSMEIFGFHESHKKWMEVGNSGLFRPEMLRSMGFPKEVSVIAWGLSLERPTMIKYNIKNIRDLFAYETALL